MHIYTSVTMHLSVWLLSIFTHARLYSCVFVYMLNRCAGSGVNRGRERNGVEFTNFVHHCQHDDAFVEFCQEALIFKWHQQLELVAYDSLRPLTRANSTVFITVNRNPNAPTVNDLTLTIEELTPVSTNIGNISASDADGVCTSKCFVETELEGGENSVRLFWLSGFNCIESFSS